MGEQMQSLSLSLSPDSSLVKSSWPLRFYGKPHVSKDSRFSETIPHVNGCKPLKAVCVALTNFQSHPSPRFTSWYVYIST